MSVQEWGRGAAARSSLGLWEPANSHERMSKQGCARHAQSAEPQTPGYGPGEEGLVLSREDWPLGPLPEGCLSQEAWPRSGGRARGWGERPRVGGKAGSRAEVETQGHGDNGLRDTTEEKGRAKSGCHTATDATAVCVCCGSFRNTVDPTRKESVQLPQVKRPSFHYFQGYDCLPSGKATGITKRQKWTTLGHQTTNYSNTSSSLHTREAAITVVKMENIQD